LRITVDANVLVRAAVGDDPEQAKLAADVLRRAELVAVTLPTLCEFVWVLSRGYRRGSAEIIDSMRRLIESATVRVDRPAVDAGLAALDGGGDFADGVIAFEGRRLGGVAFTSFDRRATELIAAIGGATHLLSTA
jgi:predicted nucleic-acid-binding protein